MPSFCARRTNSRPCAVKPPPETMLPVSAFGAFQQGGDHAHALFIGKLQLSGVTGDCLRALDGQKCAAFAARNRRARIGFGSAADDAAGMLVQLAVKI